MASIVFISILILPICGVDVHNNTGIYLHQADNIMKGGKTEMVFPEFDSTRGPLYPMLLATGFRLMGKTVHSASLVTRLFFSLGIVLTYLLGRIFYEKSTGVLAAALVATSHGINVIAEFIDTDIVLPVFVLLFVLLYYLSLSRSRRCFAILAGLSLGLALMVKESALLCLGVPLGTLLLSPRGKRRDYIQKAFWMIGAVAITLVPWIMVTLAAHGSVLPMLGALHPDVLQHSAETEGFGSSLSYWTHLLTSGLKEALSLFYHSLLREITGLGPFMVISWFILSVRGVLLRRANDLILSLTVICFLPLVLYAADTNIRPGQMTAVYMILYVSFASVVISGILHLTRYAATTGNRFAKFIVLRGLTEDSTRVNSRLVLFAGSLLVFAQFIGDGTCKRWVRSQNSLAVFSKKPFRVYGRFTTEQQEAADWLRINVNENAKIIADGYTNEALDFFDVADYDIPVFYPYESMSIALDAARKKENNARPLYLFTYSGFKSGAQRHRIIFPIFEEDIVGALREEDPDYLVISWRSLFYGEYFDKAEWADLGFANETVRIYEINLDKFEPVVFENVGVNDTIDEHFMWLKECFPDEYSLLEEKIHILGLTADELRNSPLRFPVGQIY
ncbi:MAG: glycosyltransferase family 39 protein [Planctomycetota bacterium]